MSTTSQGSFTIEREYPASPARVFRAFSDQRAKATWFGCVEGWDVLEHTLDFRVGGRETWRGGPPSGPVHRNETFYHDIVKDERIVWSYAMSVGDTRISVSLTTVELAPSARGTRLTFIEQGIYLDGYDGDEQRQVGTRMLLDSLDSALRRAEVIA